MGIEDKIPGETDSTVDFPPAQPEEKEKPKEIKEATDLDDLCAILLQKGEIVGSKSKRHPEGTVYPAEDIITAIQNIKSFLIDRAIENIDLPAHLLVDAAFNQMDLKTAFTREGHLRETVVKLFKDYAEKAVRKDALGKLKFNPDDPNMPGDST